MKQVIIIYISALAVFAVSCAGMREIERKDIFGRVSAIDSFDGAKLEKKTEIIYSDNSFNPAAIIYKKDYKGQLIPYKEEEFVYLFNNLKSISFSNYVNSRKVKTGRIDYNYSNNNIKDISYFAADEKTGILYMFAFDSYKYDENYKLTSRRFIEYAFQAETGKNTQTAQYVFEYDNGVIVEMKTWVLEKNSNKIVEKKEKNLEIVNSSVRNIEEACNLKVRGREINK